MSKKIVVLSASWHEKIVESAEKSFIEAMAQGGVSRDDIQVVKVPGAMEIPLAGKLALENGAEIAVGIGFVTDGKIYRYEFVAQSIIQSLVNVSLATNKPFLSTILTPQDWDEQSAEREAWFVDHMVVKGQEAAQAALRMLEVPAEILSQAKGV